MKNAKTKKSKLIFRKFMRTLIIIEGSNVKLKLTRPGSITESIAPRNRRRRHIIKMRCIHGMMHILARR